MSIFGDSGKWIVNTVEEVEDLVEHVVTYRYLPFLLVAGLGCGEVAPPEPNQLDELDLTESVGSDTMAPVITSVRTDDGFRQIRQDALSHLVIRGNHLDIATSVTVGELPAEIESSAPHELRASVFTPPGLLGRVDVTVVTGSGTATRPDALRVTPWVMSPTAVGGHGTYQSPMNLCDLNFDPPVLGDTVQLLAGTYSYSCSGFLNLNAGVAFEGAGRDKTFLQGPFVLSIDFGPPTATTTMRDLAFQAPILPEVLVGNLVIDRATSTTRFFIGDGASATFDHYAVEGPTTAIVVDGGSVTLDHFTYVGPGTALSVTDGRAGIAKSTIRDCGSADGVSLGGTERGAVATLDDVVIEGCDRGVVLTGPGHPFSQLVGSVTITNSKLIDNRIGVFLGDGTALVKDTVIRDDESTPRVTQLGIVTVNGDVNVVGGRISGQTIAGIAVSLSSFNDPGADLTVTGAVIDGGPVGIDFRGTDELSSVHLRSSKIRGQTVAAVQVSSGDSTIDLSSASTPEAPNVLATVSGFAIDDHRSFVSPFHKYIDATGTRLNGVVFPAQLLDGPVTAAPYFRIASSESGIQL